MTGLDGTDTERFIIFKGRLLQKYSQLQQIGL